MGHRHTRSDRSLLDGASSVDDAGSSTTDGVWDVGSVGRSDERETERERATEREIEDDGAIEDGCESDGPEPESVVRVDRGKLTDRQLEVLETAHEMGYFEYPRGANATEVATALDICPSTLAEHLAAAQTKLLADVLVEDA